MKKEFNCQKCGACCVTDDSTIEHYVGMSEKDYYQLTKKERRDMVVRIMGFDNLALGVKELPDFQGNTVTTCIALEGVVGEYVWCSIYPRRPSICRKFRAGSEFPVCMMARDDCGIF